MKKLIMISTLMSASLIESTVNFKIINPDQASSVGFEEISYNEKSLKYMWLSPDDEFIMLVNQLTNYLAELRVLPNFDTQAPLAVELLNMRAQGLDVAPRKIVAQGIRQAIELIKKTPEMATFPEFARHEILWALVMYESRIAERNDKNSNKKALQHNALKRRQQ